MKVYLINLNIILPDAIVHICKLHKGVKLTSSRTHTHIHIQLKYKKEVNQCMLIVFYSLVGE